MKHTSNRGFTLIELSIVLVIIGLIVGGILVGQDLIKAAEVRAQMSQIEKLNSAVNTFRGKFGGIPGDLSLSLANQFGFNTASCLGDGSSPQGGHNGNGLLEGAGTAAGAVTASLMGENLLFWQDLSSPVAGNLIEGSFPNSGGYYTGGCPGGSLTLSLTQGTSYIGDYLPAAKIGYQNFIHVYSYNSYNWYDLSQNTSFNSATSLVYANASIPVIEAYNMDKKMDDGVPSSGAVQAAYINNSRNITAVNTASTDSTTTCYNTTSSVYSISSLSNYGSGGNCALSFRFQ